MIGQIELFADEALYQYLAGHAPLNFCPHPPGIPLLASIGTALLGKNEYGARLLSFIIAMTTLFPVYRITYDMAGLWAARWSVLAVATTPIFVMFGVICTPDATQLFCYALSLMLTWRGMTTGQKRWWTLAGLIVGLGLYIKYIIILYFPALIICLLSTRATRKHLRTPGPYIAAFVAFSVFVPFFVVREMLTNWSAVAYHLSNRQKFIFPTFGNIATYQLGHIGYYSPVLYVLYLYAMAKMAIRAAKTGDEKAAFLASFSIFPWMFFILIAAVTKRGLSREQWDALAYVPALIAAAILLSEQMQSLNSKSIKWPRFSIIGPVIGAFIVLVVAVEGSNGVLSAAIHRKPLFSNLTGWKAMSVQADKYLAEMPTTPPPLFLGDTFAPVFEYDFYSAKPAQGVSIFSRRNEKYGLETVLQDIGAGQTALENHMGSNVLFVMEEEAENPSQSERRNRVNQLNIMFTDVTELPPLTIEIADHPVKVFRYYQCLDLKNPYPKGKPSRESLN